VEKGIKAGISQARRNAVSLKTRKTTPAST
jgi:hypothetical protein